MRPTLKRFHILVQTLKVGFEDVCPLYKAELKERKISGPMVGLHPGFGRTLLTISIYAKEDISREQVGAAYAWCRGKKKKLMMGSVPYSF